MYMKRNKNAIQQTVNKNIEKNQTPYWRAHNTKKGWSKMNYPRVLMNPRLLPKPESIHPDKNFLLNQLLQKKQKYDMQRPRKIGKWTMKPFTKYLKEQKNEQRNRGWKKAREKYGNKISTQQLTTADWAMRAKIMKEDEKKLEICPKLKRQTSNYYPVTSVLGEKPENQFRYKVKQIGEVDYELPYKTEQERHLRKLNNNILNEQTLLQVCNKQLKELNLEMHTWIGNELLNKLGYFAPNIEDLNLAGTSVSDDTLAELSITLNNLQRIDLSYCKNITADGVETMLSNIENLTSFKANNCTNAIDDHTIQLLGRYSDLEYLCINNCSNITTECLDALTDKKFKELKLSGIIAFTDPRLTTILQNSHEVLTHFDMSCLPEEISENKKVKFLDDNSFSWLGACTNLKSLNFSGNDMISSTQLRKLLAGIQKEEQDNLMLDDDKEGRFKELVYANFNHVTSLSDPSKFCKLAPNLESVILNGLQMNDNHLMKILNMLDQLQIVQVTQTENITDEALDQLREQFPNVRIVRNFQNYTDERDNGLRIPYRNKNTVKKTKKKKKK